ncbi:universal stress protein [Hymenobacter pini]|uniref:universal stress protein n=1 Tax=Hymenobacter pini TaxID=2880879 RepID=UPI001CF3770A|nr:universal stress protein [Hymenobacter pini]MCA8829396.1 universal stress protein [Hymenobacter pini]
MMTFHVLTDFSDAATNALHYAVVLARRVGGAVHLWHVQPAKGSDEALLFRQMGAEWSLEKAQHSLQDQVRHVQAYVPCQATILTEDSIAHLAASLGSRPDQLVVVGNANPAKNVRHTEHSLALHLVCTLAHPLLIVPITYRAGTLPKRIVLDTDRRAVRLPATAATIPRLLEQLTATDEPLFLGQQLGAVEELLARVGPSVLGLHVYTTPASPELADVATRIRQSGLLAGVAHTVMSTRHSSVEEGIRHAATRHQADMLTFVTRQRLYPGTHFRSSVTAGLLVHSRIPVLTIPEC